jgi:hypothetical protein
MCRSIKQLRHPTEPPTEAEIQAAALQFVRKVSGYRAPSRANQAAFDRAVAEIAAATGQLLAQLNSATGKPQPEETCDDIIDDAAEYLRSVRG